MSTTTTRAQPPSSPKARPPPSSPKARPPPSSPKPRPPPSSPKARPPTPKPPTPKPGSPSGQSPRALSPRSVPLSRSTTTTTTTSLPLTPSGDQTVASPSGDLPYVNSTLSELGDEDLKQEDEEYFVKKINKFGKSQDRIIRIQNETVTFKLLDNKTRKMIKELSMLDLVKMDIPPAKTSEKMSPLAITFTDKSKQRPFQLFFSDLHERMHFVQEVANLNPQIKIHDKSAAECAKDFLKFTVYKVTKSVKKPRIITLRTSELEMQHFRDRSKKAYRTTHMSKVVGIVRNRIDKCRVDIFYKGGGEESFIFTDPAFRERFLGRFIQLWADTSRVRISASKFAGPEVVAESMSVFSTSWNAGESKPPSPELFLAWLGPCRGHDLYAIGLQECSKKRDKWVKAILNHIMGVGQGDCYVIVDRIRLWDIMLIIIVKKKFMKYIKYVEKDTVACGKAGVLGNKGGVAIGFTIRDTSLCFINSHLAARAERLNKRENDYKKIISNMDIGTKGIDILNQYHHVVWIGDLNYRIERDWDEVLPLVEQKNWTALAQCDQLVGEMIEMKVFVGFNEGSLDFAPTYRWDRKTNTPSNKRRQPPSWTDRILWRSFPNSTKAFEFVSYSSKPNVFGSDHRPVYATFNLIPRLPYQDSKLFHSSHRGAQRHKHRTIIFTNLTMEDQSIEGVDADDLKIIFSSTVLENKVTSPSFDREKNRWKLNKDVQLTPFVREDEFLKTSYLLLTVTSNKPAKEGEENEMTEMKDSADHLGGSKTKVIGSGVLCISGAFEQGSIDCLMTTEGQVTLQLKGQITTKVTGFIDPEELGLSYLKNIRPGFNISRRPEDMMADLKKEMMRPSLTPQNFAAHNRQDSAPGLSIGLGSKSSHSKGLSRAQTSPAGPVAMRAAQTMNSSSVSGSPQLLSSRSVHSTPPPPARSKDSIKHARARQQRAKHSAKSSHKPAKSGEFYIS